MDNNLDPNQMASSTTPPQTIDITPDPDMEPVGTHLSDMTSVTATSEPMATPQAQSLTPEPVTLDPVTPSTITPTPEPVSIPTPDPTPIVPVIGDLPAGGQGNGEAISATEIVPAPNVSQVPEAPVNPLAEDPNLVRTID